MKKTIYWGILFILVLSACTPSTTQETATPPPEPSETIAPSPTLAPTKPPSPSPTPIPSETIYTSCADAPVLAQISSEFQEKTGLEVKDALAYLSKNGKISTTVDTTDKASLFHYEAMYLGYQTISLANLPDAQENDRIICAFVALPDQVAEGETVDIFPLMAGYTYQGVYHDLAGFIDAAGGDIFLSSPETKIDDVSTWLDEHMIAGDRFELLIETFYGVENTDALDFPENISLLLSLLDNGYLARMVAVNSTSPHDILDALDPSLGDIGMLAGFQADVEKGLLP